MTHCIVSALTFLGRPLRRPSSKACQPPARYLASQPKLARCGTHVLWLPRGPLTKRIHKARCAPGDRQRVEGESPQQQRNSKPDWFRVMRIPEASLRNMEWYRE